MGATGDTARNSWMAYEIHPVFSGWMRSSADLLTDWCLAGQLYDALIAACLY